MSIFFVLMSHHSEPLSSAESFVDVSLWEVVFGSGVGSQLDGLLRGRRVVLLVQLAELLGKQALKITQVSSCPLVAGICQYKKMLVISETFLLRSGITCNAEENLCWCLLYGHIL